MQSRGVQFYCFIFLWLGTAPICGQDVCLDSLGALGETPFISLASRTVRRVSHHGPSKSGSRSGGHGSSRNGPRVNGNGTPNGNGQSSKGSARRDSGPSGDLRNREALGAFLQSVKQNVESFLKSRGVRGQQVDDLIQETNLRIMEWVDKNKDKPIIIRDPAAWAVSCAYNTLLADGVKNREVIISLDGLKERFDWQESEPKGASPSPIGVAAVGEALAKLSVEQRRVIDLARGGASFDAIAEKIGRSTEETEQIWSKAASIVGETLSDELRASRPAPPSHSVVLKPRDLQALRLRFVAGYSMKDTARIMDTTEGSLRSWFLDRARTHIRTGVGDNTKGFRDMRFTEDPENSANLLVEVGGRTIRLEAESPNGTSASLPSNTVEIRLSAQETELVRLLYLEGVPREAVARRLGLTSDQISYSLFKLAKRKVSPAVGGKRLGIRDLSFHTDPRNDSRIMVAIDGIQTPIRAIPPTGKLHPQPPDQDDTPSVRLSEWQTEIIRTKHIANRSWSEAANELGKTRNGIARQINQLVLSYVRDAVGNSKLSASDLTFEEGADGSLQIKITGRSVPLQVTTTRELTLSPYSANVLAMRYVDGSSFGQIAEALGSSPAGASSNLYTNIIPRIRKVLGDDGIGPKDLRITSPPNGNSTMRIYVYPEGRTHNPIVVDARITKDRSNNQITGHRDN